MRPLEAVVVAVNITVFVLLVGAAGGRPRLAPIGLLPLPTAATQALLEGFRWQLLPACLLGGVLTAVWLHRHRTPGTNPASGRPGRVVRRLLGGLVAGLGLLGVVASAVLPAVLPVFRLPRPDGPYPVGTVTYHWTDGDRPEPSTADSSDRRELVVQVWYPAERRPSGPPAPYIEDAGAVTPALGHLRDLPEDTFGYLRYVSTHAVRDAPIAGTRLRYPVLVMLPDRGGYRQAYTFQVEELASYGYVVAVVDQPGVAAVLVRGDGRRVPYDDRLNQPEFKDAAIGNLARDVPFTLDRLTQLDAADPDGRFTGRLDLGRAGLLGHSLGATVGAEACRIEARIRACLLEDGYMPTSVVASGLRQPTMWLGRDAETMRLERQRSGGWSEADIQRHQSSVRAVFDRLPTVGYLVQVSGLFHVDMTDAPRLSLFASQLGIGGPLGTRRAQRIVNSYALAFFDRHLAGRPSLLLGGPVAWFPEVHLEVRPG